MLYTRCSPGLCFEKFIPELSINKKVFYYVMTLLQILVAKNDTEFTVPVLVKLSSLPTVLTD